MPLGTVIGCLMFGAVAGLELLVQGWGLPVSSYVIQMTPYVVALAILAAIGRGGQASAAIGSPFIRQ